MSRPNVPETGPAVRKRALITGVAGQDGVYLARHLLTLGYDVVGTVVSVPLSSAIIDTYLPGVEVIELDIRDSELLGHILDQYRPDEIYNLASWSSVARSWSNPRTVTAVNGVAVLEILDAMRAMRDADGYQAKLCQASSSEMFGMVVDLPLTIRSAHHPRSPYASAKSFAHHTAVNYRESYGIYVSNAVLFNHESPIRPPQFVTRKITRAAAEMSLGLREELRLGNLEIRRDWGAARDYVRALHLMLQQEKPADYIVATGVSRSLNDFLAIAMDAAGVADWQSRVISDETLLRPADVSETRGDAHDTRVALGWQPELSLEQLIESMVAADVKRLTSDTENSLEYL